VTVFSVAFFYAPKNIKTASSADGKTTKGEGACTDTFLEESVGEDMYIILKDSGSNLLPVHQK